MLPLPVDFNKWLVDNGHLLQPPVNNYCLFRGANFVVMLVGGPNKRTDYHINETEEYFYQVKGDMLLKVVDPKTNEFQDIPIKEGEMYLLQANTPHNPVRFADTVGIVVEQTRPAGSLDHLRWYCSNCKEIVYQESFHCTDLGSQLKPVIEKFASTPELRKCKNCGTMNEAK
ncbi:3-hydroxyanthranilic acid dioxygenase [Catenaria anguillulae PL171]|uniref:3-hydroxyanthranilate 3,4-dioxygenase n=1 Tax=Catenaria anguillulae PL171 TaxID=765915 RepID=A0A1Y2HFJ5_9FUNG|nr:3-hydroxyanthranilic acid dioxygenase [Catenaria anguillulae PL171]